AFRPDESLRPFWEEFDVHAPDLETARRATKLRAPRRIRRVWGGLGLFRALFVDELERGAHFCIFCGTRLRRQGRYCPRRDSLACFLEGRAEARRLQRRGGKWGARAD